MDMYGRSGVAGDATTTSQQGCGESTGRRLRRELPRGPRALRRRVERKKRSVRVKMLRFKSFGRRLSGFEDMAGRHVKRKGLEELEPLRCRCQEKKKGSKVSKGEQEQGETSQQLVLPAPGGFNEGIPASLMELDLPRIRGAHGECGGAGKSGAANDRRRSLSNSPSQERFPMEEEASL